jgi:hypothetical protein
MIQARRLVRKLPLVGVGREHVERGLHLSEELAASRGSASEDERTGHARRVARR